MKTDDISLHISDISKVNWEFEGNIIINNLKIDRFDDLKNMKVR